MNGTFRRSCALFASLAVLSATAVTVLAAPASASTPSSCESGCGTGLVSGPTNFGDGPYELALDFTVADTGEATLVCYPNGPSDLTDNVSIWDVGTSSLVAGPVPAADMGGGQSCAPIFAVLSAGADYRASYSANVDYYYNYPGGGTGTFGGITANGGYFASAHALGVFPDGGAGDYNYGINVNFQSYPNAPEIGAVTPAGLTSVNVSFTGDGDPTAEFEADCSSSAGPFVAVVGTSSPITVGGFANLDSQTIACVVFEQVTHFLVRSSGASTEASTTLVGASGPGCEGTVSAPTQLSAASAAIPGAVVSWAAVTVDPADCLVGYLVTPSSGPTQLVLGHGTTTVVGGLTLGGTYTFTVAAVTGSGVGPASAPTSPIAIGTPAAATAVTARRVAKGAIKVAFKPGKNNGAAITQFTAWCGYLSTSGKSGPLTVTGLKPGTAYHCTVTATNSRGTGKRSARSASAKA